ncbi:acetyl esterase/lipase [Kribbella sp. VKM Ac-2527]|uniref:Acetyl esterase/lipase n=1 Tax=Kribbella caucasensis TaxID=2512215 RepID=A0A4R6KNI1_9ACTN|nr:alpha/beta hydrolase fold domain-containing protein [Kribbella sp. VKM Ac-2527]TDO51670.1 acetyl esterase/lipase [Kribbella sp. VKM Ac-2527]
MKTDPYPAAGGLVRVYPASRASGIGLLWAHGGAFEFGDLDMPEADWVARSLAMRGITVVSVDYRLASDDLHYPGPSDDILTAWAWARDNRELLGIDPDGLSIGGASAGANLVTGAVLRMLEVHSGGLPSTLVLAYPSLLAVQSPPDQELEDALKAHPVGEMFGPARIRAMYETYFGGPIDTAPLPVTPGLATPADLMGFPPVLVINSEIDDLSISGEIFATSLRDAGRKITLITEPGTAHGHLNRPDETAATTSVGRIARWLAANSQNKMSGDPLTERIRRP